jgi:MFS family permease
MARSPKILIFLILFIDLLGFGIVIPILAPTSAVFINRRIIGRADRAISERMGLPDDAIGVDAAATEIRLLAAGRAELESIRRELDAALTVGKIGPEFRVPGSIGYRMDGGYEQVIAIKPETEGGRPGAKVALLMCAFSLLQMLFTPFWGRLSDRRGRRPILLVSLCGSTFSYVLFALAPNYEVLLVSRILAGISAANVTAALAYIADITPDHKRTAGMTLVGIAFGLGIAFGPVLGGGATHAWQVFAPVAAAGAPHEGAGWIAALICGVNLVWAWFKLPESLPPEKRGKVHFERFAGVRDALRTLRNPVVGPLILLLFIVTFAFSNLEVSFSLYARGDLGMDLRQIYGLFVYIGLVIAFTQGLVRWLVKFVPEQTLMVVGAAILVVGLALLPVWKETVPALIALGVLSVGHGLCQPSVLSLISRRTDATSQGNVFGTSQSANALARIVGPVFGGIIYDFGHRLPFWGAAAIMAGAVWWALVARGRIMRHVPEAAPAAGDE